MPNKTTRLLEYLAALTKLSTKTVFHLDEYEQVFWLHSLPLNRRFVSAERGKKKSKEMTLG